MNLRNKNKQNRIKEEVKCFLSNFKFKSINLTFSKQIVLLWVIIWYVSLFIPWIKDVNQWINWNSFYSLSWNIGFLLIIILSLPIFIILSTSYKEKIKLYSDLSLKNHFIIITSWIFIISFSIITLSFINWLHTFFEKPKHAVLAFFMWNILKWVAVLIEVRLP